MFFSILSGLFKMLGLVSWAEHLFENHEIKVQGETEQKLADANKEIQNAKDAQKTKDAIAGMSDAELADLLQHCAHKPTNKQ